MALRTSITALLVLQFALAAAVPCKCLTENLVSSAAAKADPTAEPRCSRGCCARPVEQPAADLSPDSKCVKSPHRSTCPGRMLPELAPPPSADERLVMLNATPFGPAVATEAWTREHSPNPARGYPAPFPWPPSCPVDASLLRQHCALIV